ncbi:hypothetical protein [Sorangium sp. So ce124]|uniref:hypothetical protein n=1 Tax=Sorangium sp. So ce124 TaxID=3133280 RepID=UPI003F62882F
MLCLEEAFYRFCEYVTSAWATRRCGRTSGSPPSCAPSRSVPSRPSWCPPRCAARRAAGSPFAGDPPILYAALAGRAIRGAITPNIAAVLRGEKAPDDALARELGAMALL